MISSIKSFFSPRSPRDSRDSAEAVARVASNLDKCVTCSVELPLRLPTSHETGSQWRCARCGHRYFGVIDDNCSPDRIANVTAVGERRPRHFDGANKHVDRFVDNLHVERERRKSDRFPFFTVVLVTPIDANQNETTEPFLARTQDFSATGVSLIHSKRPPGQTLALEHLTPDGVTQEVLVRITRVTGLEDGMFEIGGEFVKAGPELPKLTR